MDTNTQIERLVELAIIQRSELKRLVDELPLLKEHLSSEIERTFEETEPQLRAELEEWTSKQTADKTAALGVTIEAKIADLAQSLEISTQARYNAIIAEREQNARLAAQAEAKIAEHAASLPGAVKEIVTAELARFPRAGEIEQLRKEFAEPRGLNPRGKWQAGETYNKLDLVTINGDSYTSNTDGNRTRPSRSSSDWTLVAARGTGGGGGPTSLSELTTVPSDGDILIGSGTSWVTSNLTAGAGISITVGPGAITISATDGDITLDDGSAASPSLHFTNDLDTGLYRPAANTLGISVSGTQVAYFDENGLTIPNAGVVAGGSFHGANGNANNPSFSFTSDQDTGFYRHGTNELGISIGGTEKAVMTSTTFSITPNLSTSGNLTVSGKIVSSQDVQLGNTYTLTWGGAYGAGIPSIAGSTGAGNIQIYPAGSTSGATASFTASATTLAGNLTVSGGSIVNGTSTSVYYLGTPSNNYLYYDGSSFFARIGGADRLTISASSGNVLIGTTTDGGQKLQVNGNSGFLGHLEIPADKHIYMKQSNPLRWSSDGLSTGSVRADVYADSGGALYLRTNGSNTALTLDSSQNATFAGEVKAATQMYAEKTGAGVYGQSVGMIQQHTTVNSTTYNVTTASAKVFVISLGSGDAALCYASYKSSTVTILGSDGTIVNSSSPTSGQLGIYKSANDHVISFKTGSAAASAYGSWGFCFLGNPVISIA